MNNTTAPTARFNAAKAARANLYRGRRVPSDARIAEVVAEYDAARDELRAALKVGRAARIAQYAADDTEALAALAGHRVVDIPPSKVGDGTDRTPRCTCGRRFKSYKALHIHETAANKR